MLRDGSAAKVNVCLQSILALLLRIRPPIACYPLERLSVRNEPKKLLKHLVGKKLSSGREPDPSVRNGHQPVFFQTGKNTQCGGNLHLAEFALERCDLHTLVEAQTEEPCLLMLACRREPRDLRLICTGKERFQVVGCC